MSNISINDLNSANIEVSEGMESLINDIRDLSDAELKLSGGKHHGKGHGKGHGYGGGGDDDDDDGGGKGKCYGYGGGGDDDDD